MEHSYEGKPLNLDTAEGRLLKLSTIDSDSIHGTLHNFDIDDAPAYCAVSYVWGPRDPSQTIWIDDHPVQIRRNLYDFLRQYQRSSNVHSEYLWIDQICIDQYSIDEKNHQVELMGDIFKNAQNVLAWLGTEIDSEHLARLYNKIQKSRRYQPFNLCAQELQIWKDVIERPYWTRQWIIQELLLARNCTVMYGSRATPLQSILNMWPGWKSWQGGLEGHILDVVEKTKDWHETDPLPPRFLTRVMTMQTFCEDARDQIYGLQSVLPRALRIQVDYSKPTHEVFLDAATTFLERRPWEFNQGFEPPIVSTALAMGIITVQQMSDLDKALAKIRETPEWTSAADLRRELSLCLSSLDSRPAIHETGHSSLFAA